LEINRGANYAMTITIRLSDEEQQRLAERAARNGRDLAGYVHLLIERDIQEPGAVDQALAPFRRQVEESGMTDDGLGEYLCRLVANRYEHCPGDILKRRNATRITDEQQE
jgi:hypothetical protein